MRRAAYWLFPIIASCVAVFIVVFMVQINPSASVVSEKRDSHDELSTQDTNGSSHSWINGFKLTKEKDYSYPINEFVMQMDNKANSTKSQKYQMKVLLRDSYEFFCLKQELKTTNLSYLLNQEGSSMSVEIDSDDYNALTNLLLKLKTYQITATLLPLKEE
jgi:hypothetical protein